MPSVEDGFASLSRVRVPEQWSDVRGRQPGPTPDGPSGPRRLAVAAVALAVFVAGFAVLTRTFGEGRGSSVGSSPTPSSTSATPTATTPPPTPSPTFGAIGQITPVLELPGVSTSIAAAPAGPVFVSVHTAPGDRRVLRWDPATGDVLASDPIPGSQVAFVSDWLWAVGDDGGDPAETTDAPAAYRIDPEKLLVVQTVDLPSVPGVVAAGPDGSVWIGVDGELILLDPLTGAIQRRMAVRGKPTLLSFDPSGAHAYVVTDARAGADGDLLVELDAGTGGQIATTAVGYRDLGGPSSIAASDAGVWVSFPTGMMGRASLLAEGTLREVRGTRAEDATTGSNAQTVSSAAGVVWLSDMGSMRCLDPDTAALGDTFETGTRREPIDGGRVVETSAGLVLGGLLDGSPYLLRLDPPRACGATGS